MRRVRTAFAAGVAAIALAGLSGQADARTQQVHILTVQLPDGGTEQIRYTGRVAPEVVFAPDTAPDVAFTPARAMFGEAAPFALLEQISAQMAELMGRAAAPGPGGLTEAVLGDLPPGSTSLTMVSSMTGAGVCTRTTRIVSGEDGTRPHVVSRTSGNCGAPTDATVPAAAEPAVPLHRDRTRTIQVRGTGNYRALVRPAAAWQQG